MMPDSMHFIIEARAMDGYRLWIKFDDGAEGVVDLSDIVGKGVFTAWDDPARFREVRVDPEASTVVWPGDIDLCPDTLYEDLTKAG